MQTILFVFVGMLCMMLGIKVFCAEERNKVFNKRPIEVTDVKKYNRFCGSLIIGFGVAAEITMYFMVTTEGLLSTVLTLGVIVEAILLMAIYNKFEIRFLKKR